MNRTLILMGTLLFCITLLFLQFSCTVIKEKQSMEIQRLIDEKVPEVRLLADKHKETGIECSNCHEESPPEKRPPGGMCLECHGGYKEVAASYIDPHNAHHTSPDCGVCHHVHKPSEKICQGCHTFNLQAP